MRAFPVLALLTTAISLVGPAAAQEKNWVGKTVVVKKAGIKIGHSGADGKQIYVATLGLADYQVVADEGGWLMVKAGNAEGWFDKADAVPLEDAVAYFTGRIQANPGDALAYYLRGFVRLRNNDVDGAIGDYGAVLRLQPTDDVYGERGVLWARKGNYDQAILDFDAALNLCAQLAQNLTDPKMMTPDLSGLSRREGRWVRFFKLEQMAGMMMSQMVNEIGKIAFEPKKAYYLALRGDAWEHKGDHDRAVADCGEALRLDVASAPAYRTRGRAWQAKREYGKALADLEAARRLEPQNASCLAALAWVLATAPDANLRDGKRAVELAKEALALAPKGAASTEFVAAAYAEQGDFTAAVRWQEQALRDENAGSRTDARRRLELYKQKQPYRQP